MLEVLEVLEVLKVLMCRVYFILEGCVKVKGSNLGSEVMTVLE